MDKSRVEFVCLSFSEYEAFINYLESLDKADSGGVLILSYPKELDGAATAFNEFYQSPSRVNKFSHIFTGLFAVNLTDYLFKSSSPKIEALFDYIEENEDICFLLFAFQKKNGDADEMERRLFKLFENSRRTLMPSAFRNGEIVERKRKNGRDFGY